MHLGRWTVWGGLIGTVALIAAACGTSPSTGASSFQSGKELVVALPVGVTLADFAPIASTQAYTVYNSQAEYMMYAPLVMVSGSDTIDWADSIAQSITPNANNTVFTVTLKPWQWSNGQPITAQDVAYTTNLLLQDCSQTSLSNVYAYGGCNFGGIPQTNLHAVLKSVQATGTNTVQFTMSAPTPNQMFDLNLLGQIQPMPESVWNQGSTLKTLQLLGKIYNSPTASQYSVVSGPYKFASMVANGYWKFVPNPNYGGTKATVTVVEQYESSDSAEFAALKKQTINAGELYLSDFGAAGQMKGLYNAKIDSSGFCWAGIQMNFANAAEAGVGPAFQDPTVRAALQMGMNQTAIGKVLYGSYKGSDLALPTYSIVPSGYAAITSSVFGTNSIPNPYPYNPKAAKKLLEHDGYSLNAQNVMQKGNIILEFPLNYDSESTETQNAAVVLKNEWAQIGVQVTPNPVAFDTLVAMTDAQSQWVNKWAMNWFGGWCYEPNYYPTGGGMWSYYNATDEFKDAAFNKAVAAEYQSGSVSQVQANMLAYAKSAAKELPFLFTPTYNLVYETAPYVHGFNASFDPVEAFFLWNHITISH